MVLSWTSQRIFFNVINDDSTADAIAGVIVGIVIFCMTIYYFSRFLFFVIDLCEGIQQKRLRYKDTVNMANFKAILLSDRSEFVMKEHKMISAYVELSGYRKEEKEQRKNIGL